MSSGNLIQAIRGPIMLITLGSLFALSQMTRWGFEQTWPLLIIIFGVLKLAERMAIRDPQYGPDGGGEQR